MEKVLLSIREVLFSLVIIAVVVAVGYFMFKDKYPYQVEVPEAVQYVSLNKDEYKVVGDIQNAQNPTETFETSTSELDIYQTESRYVPGSINPFVADKSQTDLPSETVSSTSRPAATTQENAKTETTTETLNGENVE